MSISIIGIISVQLFWLYSSLDNNREQFKYNVSQVLNSVAEKLTQDEITEFYRQYNTFKDSLGHSPKRSDFKEIIYEERNPTTNERIIYSNTLVREDYDINKTLFDKNADSSSIFSYTSKRKTEIYNGSLLDNSSIKGKKTPDITIEKDGAVDVLDKAAFTIYYKDIVAIRPITERISKEKLYQVLAEELENNGISTHFEFCIYGSGLATKVKSDNFFYDKESTYNTMLFLDNDNTSKFQLLVSFPTKNEYLFSSVLGLSLLSILFTIIIIATYYSAIMQLKNQKEISEIKSDFINNMTHEFKTPIATINLALDSIKNPKIFNDSEKVLRYLGMIKEENKRMLAQVDNVLQISRLEKNEVDIAKEPHDIHEIIEDAIDHVYLLIEDKGGEVKTNLTASLTDVSLNNMHFTNVMTNLLDNAIKYSPEAPKIEVITENTTPDFITIKVKDHGQGMSKIAVKRVFEKFYREHTGNIHNVKGHGLGLAYVKNIVEDHNGQISVESEKGKGSTFTIKMPLIKK
nr:HAMP domain-containing sensor histidine kinase [uncultured Flavobacterium sp.]